MLINDKVALLKKYALNSFIFDWDLADNEYVVNSSVDTAIRTIENYLGYPLENSEIKQLVDYPTKDVYLSCPALNIIYNTESTDFQKYGFIRFTKEFSGVVHYKAGWSESTLPKDIEFAIARIALVYLTESINNTVGNSTVSQNIGGQTTEVTKINTNAVNDELSKIEDRKSYNIFAIYNVVETNVDSPINVLIYDDFTSNHYTNVKKTFEFYREGTSNFFEFFNGFSTNPSNDWRVSVRNFCSDNNIKVVMVPWGSISTRDALQDLILDDVATVIPYYDNINNNLFNIYFASTIRIQQGTTGTATLPSLDFYSDINEGAIGLTSSPSYVTGKIGAMVANLMAKGYNAWEARQILRQNADSFYYWSLQDGFGKIGESIEIPETIFDVPATTVMDFGGSENHQRLITFRSPSGFFDFNGLWLSQPTTILSNRYDQAVSYELNFQTQYGTEFASHTVNFDANPDGIPLVGNPLPPTIVE